MLAQRIVDFVVPDRHKHNGKEIIKVILEHGEVILPIVFNRRDKNAHALVKILNTLLSRGVIYYDQTFRYQEMPKDRTNRVRNYHKIPSIRNFGKTNYRKELEVLSYNGVEEVSRNLYDNVVIANPFGKLLEEHYKIIWDYFTSLIKIYDTPSELEEPGEKMTTEIWEVVSNILGDDPDEDNAYFLGLYKTSTYDLPLFATTGQLRVIEYCSRNALDINPVLRRIKEGRALPVATEMTNLPAGSEQVIVIDITRVAVPTYSKEIYVHVSKAGNLNSPTLKAPTVIGEYVPRCEDDKYVYVDAIQNIERAKYHVPQVILRA